MDDFFVYDCNLNIEGFIHMLDDPTECYKFYWLDSILQLLAQGKDEITFDDVISGMIADAWYTVTEYRLRMGTKDTKGNSINSIERAVNKLSALNVIEATADRECIINLISGNDSLVHDEKYQISKNVPYRVLSSFLENIRGNDPLWDQRTRLIAYLEALNRTQCLPYTIGMEKGLKKRIVIDKRWKSFLIDNIVTVRGWIQMKKIKYLQDRNPGVPGVMYKLEPGKEKQRKLQNVRKLWKAITDVTKIKDIYTGSLLKKDYEIDHFVPWSFITNDEMWNLMPVDASLNSSKRDRLPDWDKYFCAFAQNQYELNEYVYQYPRLYRLFKDCQRDNLNSLWCVEELYIVGIQEEKFVTVLEGRLKPIYDSAHTQGYGIWMLC